MAKWCNEGETLVGNIFLKNSPQVVKYLGLYKNVSEPAESDTLSDIIEPNGYGYSRILLEDDDWTEGEPGVFTNVQKEFLASGGDWGNVYGYFITDVASGISGSMITAENFSDGPYNVTDGKVVRVTPTVTIT